MAFANLILNSSSKSGVVKFNFKNGNEITMQTLKNGALKAYARTIKSQGNKMLDSKLVIARKMDNGDYVITTSCWKKGQEEIQTDFILNRAGTRLIRLKELVADTIWQNSVQCEPPKGFFDIVRKIFKGKVKI